MAKNVEKSFSYHPFRGGGEVNNVKYTSLKAAQK